MHSSIRAVFTAPQPVLMMYTSSSRTDSAIRTFVSPMPLCVTSARATCTPSLGVVSHLRVRYVIKYSCYRLQIVSANCGWLVPYEDEVPSIN
jgi:hypothetical protein